MLPAEVFRHSLGRLEILPTPFIKGIRDDLTVDRYRLSRDYQPHPT
jgi:hypothetical protein